MKPVTPSTSRRPFTPARQRGVAMMIVLAAVAMVTILSMAFLSAQTTTTGITRNLQDKAVARQIAEAGMIIIKEKILAGPEWREGRTNGLWIDNQALNGGSFSVTLHDEDGDPAAAEDDPFTLTVTGRYLSAVHTVRFRVQPYGSAQGDGLTARYFTTNGNINKLDKINWDGVPDYTETLQNLNRPKESNTPAYPGGPKTQWGASYKGYINIPTTGLWTFHLDSDDGSALFINGDEIIDNDGAHAMKSVSGSATLDKGSHAFEARFFQAGGHQGIVAYWQGPGIAKEVIPASAFTGGGGDDEDGGDDGDAGGGSNDRPIAVSGSIRMWSNSKIQASSNGGSVTVTTNGTASQTVQMSDNAKIEGNLMVGPNAANDAVVNWGKSSITGGVTKLSAPVDIPAASAPAGAPASSNYFGLWSGSDTISTNKRYSGMGIGGTLNIQGDVTIWCEGFFQLSNSAKLIIPQGSKLKLYITGGAGIYGQSHLNFPQGSPDQLEIHIIGNNNFQFSDQAKGIAHIKNPGGPLYIYGQSQFTGSFMGKQLEMSDQAKFFAEGGQAESEEDPVEEEPATALGYIFQWDEGL